MIIYKKLGYAQRAASVAGRPAAKGEAAKNVCGKCEKRDYCLHTKDFSFVNERRSKQSKASR